MPSPGSSPLLIARQGAKEVRERSDARQRERDIEPPVLRHGDPGQAQQVPGLPLHRYAAALRIVVADDPQLQERFLSFCDQITRVSFPDR